MINNQQILLFLAIILTLAVIALLINKLSQPSVLGQILAGIIIAILAHYKIGLFTLLPHNNILRFFATLGSIFLLFEIGLESTFAEIKNAGMHASIVALIGVIVPFLLGYFVITPYVLSSQQLNLSLFMGSILAVTSTGISISVFKDLHLLKDKACQIVLAASIIDDIIGLILLSLVTGLATFGQINWLVLSITVIKAVLFFVFSIILGRFILPFLIIKVLIKISNSEHLVVLTLIVICLWMSYLADLIGLAPIIGAFIAGMFLKDKLFNNYQLPEIMNSQPLENKLVHLISPLGKIFIPLFFIYAGMQVDIIAALNWPTAKLTLIFSSIAILSKLSVGTFLPKGINRWLVGFGMVPRGEIGIIFALAGLELKLINNEVFAALLLMIVITSLITPIALNKISNLFYS